jgi:serine beta-lactamase-like protein LACTB, mitochondrial
MQKNGARVFLSKAQGVPYWWAFLFAVVLSFVGASPAQDAQLSPERRVPFEDAIKKFMAETNAPGVSVALVENGEAVWAAGFGMADLENSVPATATTLYRLGSISKPLTAVAALELWERGRLDLDAPVQKYCPAFPQKEGQITTRELLGHLAGIRHYRSDSPDDPEVSNTKHFEDGIQGGLDFFKNDALVDKPGAHFHYSTHGYTVVGCAIEGASGGKYVEFVRENVFARASMSQTQADNHYSIIPHRTRFYHKDKTAMIVNADFLDSSYKIPGGGWLSSADDMAQFEIAVLKDRLLRRSTRELMWTPLKPSDGSEDNYGLGWSVDKKSGVLEVGHDGGQQGTSTAFLIAPAQQDGVVVLLNMDGLDPGKLAGQLMSILLSKGGNGD